MPASSSTRKCLLIAWRVRRDPCANWAIDRGKPPTNVPTSARRVASPSAAKTEARSSSSVKLDMPRNALDLLAPARVIHAIGLEAALHGDGGKAGFGYHEQGASGVRLEPEFHQRGWLLGIIDRRIDGIGMPGEGEQALRLQPLHGHLPRHVLVTGVSDLAARPAPRLERLLELDAEPSAKLSMVRQRAPNARNRGLEFGALFDAIIHGQPPGCGLHGYSRQICNLFVAPFAGTGTPPGCRDFAAAKPAPGAGAAGRCKGWRVRLYIGRDFGLNR